MKNRSIIYLVFALALTPFFLMAQYDPDAVEKAKETIEVFKAKNAKFENYFSDAYGYVVLPSVGKGASVVGAAHGAGTAFEGGVPVGKTILTQVTIGLQFGGQAYSQVVFFESKADFLRFKQNKLQFAAQASAIAIDKGAAANLSYVDGVAVFTITKAGLMYEASLGGQKLKFKPFEKNVETSGRN